MKLVPRRAPPPQGIAGPLGYPGAPQGPGPRLPPGVSWDDVLFLWDPLAHPTRDWAGQQTLTAGGTDPITYEVASDGNPFARFGNDSWLIGTPFGTSLGDIGEHCVYLVRAPGAGYFVPFSQSAPIARGPTAGAGSIDCFARADTNGSWSAVYTSAGFTQNIVGAGALWTVAQSTHRFAPGEIQTWHNGSPSTPSATAHDPGAAVALDRLRIGGMDNVSAADAGAALYALSLKDGRRAEVDAWCAATFPIGEDLTP